MLEKGQFICHNNTKELFTQFAFLNSFILYSHSRKDYMLDAMYPWTEWSCMYPTQYNICTQSFVSGNLTYVLYTRPVSLTFCPAALWKVLSKLEPVNAHLLLACLFLFFWWNWVAFLWYPSCACSHQRLHKVDIIHNYT